ncbi:NAD-dependent epimerase/dehydratase family protein [Halorubrum amylolyticum]|uniref:NAD-dependent epimerase/dehydratase family protein n=1 Tax=Halorubrum amylolyticum TaxID=2508724 RepID=UPI001008E84F|nr:NAD-dependent epimerase/dehydratase family protein [Halorubrum amylolyticum]
MTETRSVVTGGAGFLGSHLCERLLADGHEVVCVDNFGSGRRENIATLRDHDSFSVFEADLREEPELPPTDEIYHLASRASPSDFTDFPVQIALTNTRGTKYLLEHAVEHDATMLFASTSEVYGDPEVHPQTEGYNGNVNIRGPRGCYDESKRFGETLAVAYHEKYGVDVRTIRIFNTYGPKMRADDGRVVPTFLKQAANGDDLTVYGSGNQTRTFCYVDDMIDGIRDVMRCEALAGDVVNVGGQNEVSIRTLAQTVLEICDTNSDVVYEPLPQDDPTKRRPDVTKAQRLFDWSPSVGLMNGLRRTLKSFEKPQDGTIG